MESVRESMMGSVLDSVWESVGESVWESVGESVWESVGESVWKSVREVIYAYMGSFFTLPEWKFGVSAIRATTGEGAERYPYQPAIDLWNRGLVPSFDGKIWRLHSGPTAKIVYTHPVTNK